MIEFKEKGSKELVLLYVATQCRGKGLVYNQDLLHVRENDCFTTDGHAMFMVKDNLGLEPGAYRILKRAKSNIQLEKVDSQSPDVSRVIPRLKDEWPVVGDFKIGYNNPALIVAAITRAMEKNTIDQNKVPVFSSANSHFSVKVKDDLSPVVFENDSELALVMPLRC